MSEKLLNKKCNQLTGHLILAGEGRNSQYKDLAGSSIKKVSRYKFIHVNEQGCVSISSENSEMLIIDYCSGYIKGAFLAVGEEEDKHFIPIKGILCGIWCEEKKKSNKWYFTWCDIQEKEYKHAEFKTYGFDDDFVMKVFGLVFSCLQKTLSASINVKIAEKLPELSVREEEYNDRL